jgi:hypothetical protein
MPGHSHGIPPTTHAEAELAWSPAPVSLPNGSSDSCPLIVDLDGSLVRTNLLWEGLARLALRQPGLVAGALAALARGRASFKAYVATEVQMDLERVPLEPSVVRLIQERIEAGQPVILASGAHESQWSISAGGSAPPVSAVATV